MDGQCLVIFSIFFIINLKYELLLSWHVKGHSAETQGVKTLLGDPKKAVIRLAIPMIIAMSAHTLYNLADGLWARSFHCIF
jgi:hypothetical protein